MSRIRAITKKTAKRLLFLIFKFFLRFGIVILPKHYYVPIADVNELARTTKQWARRSGMPGVRSSIDEQIAFLRQHVLPYQSEFLGNRAYYEGIRSGFGPGFGFIEAQAYHGILRSLKPKRIIEIGSGISTHCAIVAVRQSAAEKGGSKTEITCVEPHPSTFVRTSSDVTLRMCRVEDLPVEFFDSLDDGDLLFIDSSHAIRPGGDVIHLYCEVLPRLRSGVLIHIHDIFFPFTYQANILESPFQWSETCLLQTLLVNNWRLRILACLSLLHYDAPDALAEIFPEYRHRAGACGLHVEDAETHAPSSIYLRA